MNDTLKLPPPDTSGPADPEDLERLVDDELDEVRRSALLRQLEAANGGWRTLALRFLQRQVERRVVLDMLQAHRWAGRRQEPGDPGRWRLRLPTGRTLRLAAAIVVTAALFAGGGLYIGRMSQRQVGPAPRAVAARMSFPAHQGRIRFPPGLALERAAHPALPVFHAGTAPAGYPFMHPGGAGLPQRIIVVSDGSNRVIAYPVVPVVAPRTPLY